MCWAHFELSCLLNLMNLIFLLTEKLLNITDFDQIMTYKCLARFLNDDVNFSWSETKLLNPSRSVDFQNEIFDS